MYFFLCLCVVVPGASHQDGVLPCLGQSCTRHKLRSSSQLVPRGSVPTFHRTMGRGLTVRLSVRLAHSKGMIMFRSRSLGQVYGTRKAIRSSAFSTLRRLRLSKASRRVPLFSSILHCIGKQIPLLVRLGLPSDGVGLYPTT